MSKPKTLRFGIQSLDRLIGSVTEGADRKYGIDLSEPPQQEDSKKQLSQVASSICLAGPDGTGKSVFSLHLASHYLADCLNDSAVGTKRDRPKVLYISTDLTYAIASRGWNSFELNHPLDRREPLLEPKDGRKDPPEKQIEIALHQYFPAEDSVSDKSIIDYLDPQDPGPTNEVNSSSNLIHGEVCFVDLATRTAGDDWGFAHRLISMLNEPAADEPRHLVVLDAVEGFETLVGDLNAFGERSSRRSRIAQVMRLASGKAHLLLVVEESRVERFPEEFVTDAVVRLRNVETGRYLRRTVEIEKARGQRNIRGQHPFVIRDGKGSTTGDQKNADDPEVKNAAGRHQAYVHVFLSPNYSSRQIMADKHNPRPTVAGDRFAAFGVPYLDNMLGGSGEKAEIHKDQEGEFDTRGLPCGSATALLGDSLTQKSQLGEAFLSRAFYPYAENLEEQIAKRAATEAIDSLVRMIEQGIPEIAARSISAGTLANQVIEEVERQIGEIVSRLHPRPGEYKPVTVMFTTRDINHDDLAEQFYRWLKDDDPAIAKEVAAWRRTLQRKQKGLTEPDDLKALTESRITHFANQFAIYEDQHKGNFETFKAEDKYRRGRNLFTKLLVKQVLKREIKSYIREHTICRRLEIHDIPSAILMHIFQRNIEMAQRTMLGLKSNEELPDAAGRFGASWRIRIVIDDLNSFRSMFPEIREDPLMLPSLLFMLGREGVTSLIIDTQSSGSPDLPITERFDSSVRELVQTRIYTWRLPFYGENRVAIGLIPPISHEYRGVIRELRWETKGQHKTDRALTVDPHFELYLGLERGRPQPVPLEVKLYAETPSFKRYIESEEKLFAEIFVPVLSPNRDDTPRIIRAVEIAGYETLRDSCHLQRDTRTDHTTIIQVDEFWWLRRPRQRMAGAFRSQWNYLSSVTTSRDEMGNFRSEPAADPFGVFQPGIAWDKLHDPNGGKSLAGEPKKGAQTDKSGAPRKATRQLRKLNFFDDHCGYGLVEILEGRKAREDHEGRREREAQYVDRVPFTWDFGFLLCNGYAWEGAIGASDDDGLVKQVWGELQQTNKPGSQPPIDWCRFLKASKFVAEFQSYKTSNPATALDFTMLTPESFSCLILEMWASEVYSSLRKYEQNSQGEAQKIFKERKKRLIDTVAKKGWSTGGVGARTLLDALKDESRKSLGTILRERKENQAIHGYSLELYKVWLLLIESINFSELVDSSSHLNFEFKSRDVGTRAVSARHWYKTASKFIDSLTPEQLEYNWVPTRLPGHFSVRADWFLAVAGGSRSSRLGDHALDLLSSHRANVTRLQEGIGLPPRRLFDCSSHEDDNKGPSLRTRLISLPEDGPLTNVKYEDLLRIGASKDAASDEFYWLWRSGIAGYNRHSRIWHKWLNRTLLWWNSWQQRYGSSWTGGFKVYDDLTSIEFTGADPGKMEDKHLESWDRFGDLRDILIAELEQVSISSS
jgi:KaiC/GvpD/RAD55 family RecA-like ATPase